MSTLRVVILRALLVVPVAWCVACSGSSSPNGPSVTATSGGSVSGSSSPTSPGGAVRRPPRRSRPARRRQRLRHHGCRVASRAVSQLRRRRIPRRPAARKAVRRPIKVGVAEPAGQRVDQLCKRRLAHDSAGPHRSGGRLRRGASGLSARRFRILDPDHFQLIPEHSKSMRDAVVTVYPLDGGSSRTVRSRVINTAGDVKYYSVNIPIGAPGTTGSPCGPARTSAVSSPRSLSERRGACSSEGDAQPIRQPAHPGVARVHLPVLEVLRREMERIEPHEQRGSSGVVGNNGAAPPARAAAKASAGRCPVPRRPLERSSESRRTRQVRRPRTSPSPKRARRRRARPCSTAPSRRAMGRSAAKALWRAVSSSSTERCSAAPNGESLTAAMRCRSACQ